MCGEAGPLVPWDHLTHPPDKPHQPQPLFPQCLDTKRLSTHRVLGPSPSSWAGGVAVTQISIWQVAQRVAGERASSRAWLPGLHLSSAVWLRTRCSASLRLSFRTCKRSREQRPPHRAQRGSDKSGMRLEPGTRTQDFWTRSRGRAGDFQSPQPCATRLGITLSVQVSRALLQTLFPAAGTVNKSEILWDRW